MLSCLKRLVHDLPDSPHQYYLSKQAEEETVIQQNSDKDDNQ